MNNEKKDESEKEKGPLTENKEIVEETNDGCCGGCS